MKEQYKLGEQIKKLRIKEGMKRQELSMLSMVNYTTLMNIENGKSNPTLKTLHRLAIFLGVNMKELFDYDTKD